MISFLKIRCHIVNAIFLIIVFSSLFSISIPNDFVEAENSPQSKSITLVAVGDIMMHQAQLDATYNKATNSYDFSSFFKYVNPYLKGDIVYANLETPIAGADFKYTGYPTFNAPVELLTELKSNFFTHLSLTNNHALDRGAVGLGNTVSNVANAGLIGIGARSDIQKPNYQITEMNGLRIGFLSYTYGTNGFQLSSTNSYMLSYINKEQIAKDIHDLKNQNVDTVVVAYHFGEEYKRTENKLQRQMSQLACDSGADIVLGSHPHVLEPIVFLNNHKCLVAYSLGNFISAMSAIYTDTAGILKIEIKKEGNVLSIIPDFMGTWVKRGFNKDGSRYYSVVPLDAEKIPADIKLIKAEKTRLDVYRKFIDSKIKIYKK